MKSSAMRTAVMSMMVVLALLVSTGARAQELNLGALDQAQNVVHVRTGAEYGFVAGAGYARVVPFLDRQLVLTGDFTLPWAGLDLSDYRLRVGVLMPIVGARRWKLAGSIAPTVRGTKNDISRMTDVGADIGLVGGYYAPRWFVAAELGFDWAMTTYVAHSDAYRATVYAGARDGWYAKPGGNIRGGLQGGVSFGRYDVVLRVGELRDTGGEPPLLPFYGTLAFDTRW
jgi:hypothetical protein